MHAGASGSGRANAYQYERHYQRRNLRNRSLGNRSPVRLPALQGPRVSAFRGIIASVESGKPSIDVAFFSSVRVT
jgi:hypothetical protein